METKAQAIIRRNQELQKTHTLWHELWQLVGEFIHQLKLDFTGKTPEGTMLNDQLFDTTGVDACTKSAAALIGMLWRSGSKSFQAQPPRKIKQSIGVKKYFEFLNETLRSAIDDPRAGFANAFEEYMVDNLAFGTSALSCFEGTESDLSFEAWGVDEMKVSFGRNGQLDELYREYCWPLRQIVRTYGVENLSPKLQERARANQLDEKFTIIHALEVRTGLKAGNLSNLNMPIASFHVEKDSKHVILESGYPEWPSAVGMFYRRKGEHYGRSPGIKALPDVLELNTLAEAEMLAIELKLEPPIGTYSDSIAGNQKIDQSPRGVTVFKASGKLKNGLPVFPLIDGADLRDAEKKAERLMNRINQHFLIDRLIDFNNDAEMTLGEVQYRAQLRGESLGSVFGRQLLVIQHIIERATSIMYRKGKLGVIEGSIEHRIAMSKGEDPMVIPAEIAELITKGEDFYSIKFFSPAARMLEAEEANGIRRTYEAAAMMNQARGGASEALDLLDDDKSLEIIAHNVGAPPEILAAKQQIDALRAQRAEMLEQQAAMQEAANATQIAEQASNIKPAA